MVRDHGILYVIACPSCGGRDELPLPPGWREGDPAWSDENVAAFYSDRLHAFGDEHDGCADRLGQALPIWPESTWEVPNSVPEPVAYWVDGVLDQLPAGSAHSSCGWRGALLRLPDGQLRSAIRPMTDADGDASGAPTDSWHQPLHALAVAYGAELEAALTIVLEPSLSLGASMMEILGAVYLRTHDTALKATILPRSSPTVGLTSEDLAWQPDALPRSWADGLFSGPTMASEH